MPGITILVTAGSSAGSSSVSATGSVLHVITDPEVTTFGISDAALKAAIAKYFGQAPDDVFLHSSTPWGDLYKTYNWPQVEVTLSVVSATITGLTSNPTILATQSFINNSGEKGTYNCAISQNVTNTFETDWSMTETFSVTDTVKYEIGFLGEGVSGSTSLSFGMSFGQGGNQSTATSVGSSSGVQVELEAGESIDAQLSASQGTLNIRIVYQASLSGCAAVNYGGTYKGHHFYALPIASVMHAAGINNALQITQDITVGYFTNSTVELTNPASGSKIAAVKATSATGNGLTKKN